MTIQRLMKVAALGCILTASYAGLAAEDLPSQKGASFNFGLVASYQGSLYQGVEGKTYALPLVIGNYGDFYLQGVTAGYTFFRTEKGLEMSWEIERTFDGFEEGDSEILAGLGDRDAAWESGLSCKVMALGGQIQARVLGDLSGIHDGWSAKANYERLLLSGEQYSLSWYAGGEIWDRSKTDYYFGVDASVTMSWRPEYEARESFRAFVGGNFVKQINSKVFFVASVEYRAADDRVENSPIVDRADEHSAYAGIFYRF